MDTTEQAANMQWVFTLCEGEKVNNILRMAREDGVRPQRKGRRPNFPGSYVFKTADQMARFRKERDALALTPFVVKVDLNKHLADSDLEYAWYLLKDSPIFSLEEVVLHGNTDG